MADKKPSEHHQISVWLIYGIARHLNGDLQVISEKVRALAWAKYDKERNDD